ncbi:hypothetical protein [Ochrobactrum sp. A-1]|uniref:hypothetical protein n=1 Tax=Ochrobactrum sp. A-1 TaxID=2920940 RepID=UPI001F0A50D8|nr:hypothetical protein [Ochrobactrum sp. A-1]
MRRRLGVILVGLLATCVSANAQWVYTGKESAFDDDSVHMAFTGQGAYGLGFRCRGSKIEAVYLTPDTSFNQNTYQTANTTHPKMKIRVDKNPIVDVDVELSDADGKAGASGVVGLKLLEAVRDAKNRVAVVLNLLGENYHEQSFNVRGSGKAIGQIIDGCGLKSD